ncbi:MCP four helix bundle domain-containing protein [candidate division KSB1 bacterium]
MGLRIKILSGFLVLSLMLFIAGVWSIYELSTVGSSVKTILDENYQSINASKTMIEAIEREDSAILFLLLGKWKEGRTIINSADSLFNDKLQFAYTNITIKGEKEFLDDINAKYSIYKNIWEKPIVDTQKEGNLEWYFEKVHESFLSVRHAIEELININDRNMYTTSTELENRANRAIMPGIIATLSALIFTIIFNYLVNYFMVSPIIKITNSIKKFEDEQIPFEVEIESKDEIYLLADTIKGLCDYISVKDKHR